MWRHTFLYRLTLKTYKEHLALIEFIEALFYGLLRFRGYVNHVGIQPIIVVYTFIHLICICIYGSSKAIIWYCSSYANFGQQGAG